MYTVKNVRSAAGRDGEAFSATLYCGSKRVAYIVNSGCGGMTDVDFIADSRAEADAMEQEFAAWVRANCAGHWIAQYVDAERGDGPVALGADMLVEQVQRRQWLNRNSRGQLLFRVAGDDEDAVRVLSRIGVNELAQACAMVAGKYPDAEIWDPTTSTWTPVATLVGA